MPHLGAHIPSALMGVALFPTWGCYEWFELKDSCICEEFLVGALLLVLFGLRLSHVAKDGLKFTM